MARNNFLILGLLAIPIFILIFFIGFYTDVFSYKVYYKPMYYILSESFYRSYFTYLIKWSFFSLFSIIVLYLFFNLYVKDQKSRVFKIIISILLIFLPCCIVFTTGKDLIKDLKLIQTDSYLSGETYLSKVTTKVTKGGRGPNRTKYEIEILKFIRDKNIKEDSYSGTRVTTLDLDVYQYKEISKKINEYQYQNIDIGKIKVKLDYLPNTQTLLNYGILESK